MTVTLDCEFETKLTAWIAGCQDVLKRHHETSGNVGSVPTLSLERGKRYIRVVREDGHSSRWAFAFIDSTNGDVLKPAGWKGPAKHARGNIFKDDNGLKFMGPYGPVVISVGARQGVRHE